MWLLLTLLESLKIWVLPFMLVPISQSHKKYVIDLPPYFSIYLSRDFTAKFGGYLSFDWSHMFFRMSYGTKFNIKLEGLVKDQTHPHVPSVINVNLAIYEQEDRPIPWDPNTPFDDILDSILDEWASKNLERILLKTWMR